MIRRPELDLDLMWPRRQANDDHRLVARVCPDPGCVTYPHVNMSDTRRNRKRGGTEVKCLVNFVAREMENRR